MSRAGGEPTGPALAPGAWRVPRPVLAGSLIGSGAGADTVGVALQRVVATLLGALLAAGIALGLWRLDQWRQQT